MIIDTSAIMAILMDEPEKADFVSRIVGAPERRVSAGSWIELAAVQVSGERDFRDALDRLMFELEMRIDGVSAEQGLIGHQAYREFGHGSGHRARLNFGDCFPYALARETGEPLLFKGDDFVHTDIQPAA